MMTSVEEHHETISIGGRRSRRDFVITCLDRYTTRSLHHMKPPSADRAGVGVSVVRTRSGRERPYVERKKAWSQQCKPRSSWRPSAGMQIRSISVSPPKTVSSLAEYPSRLSADLTIAPARRRCERPGSRSNISPAHSPRRAASGAMPKTPKDIRPREHRGRPEACSKGNQRCGAASRAVRPKGAPHSTWQTRRDPTLSERSILDFETRGLRKTQWDLLPESPPSSQDVDRSSGRTSLSVLHAPEPASRDLPRPDHAARQGEHEKDTGHHDQHRRHGSAPLVMWLRNSCTRPPLASGRVTEPIRLVPPGAATSMVRRYG